MVKGSEGLMCGYPGKYPCRRWVACGGLGNAVLLVNLLLGYLYNMKMTFDLPAGIARQLKVRAAEDGLKLKDLITEACRALLEKPRKAGKTVAPKRFPTFFHGGQPAKPGTELMPEKVDEILWGR